MARTVLVTGGSSGIGRAIAARFAADGAQVFITGRTGETVAAAAEELDRDTPGNVVGVVCDSTDSGQLIALSARLDGGVDVLVNASGGLVPAQPEASGITEDRVGGGGSDADSGDRGDPGDGGDAGDRGDSGDGDSGTAATNPLEELRETWQAYVAQNVLGAVLTTAAVRDLLGPGSTVISIGSIGAERRGGAYGAAKAALAAWSAGLSAELGPNGVTVNVVSPGYIESTGFFQGGMTEARHDLLVAETHDRRAGTTQDVAELVFFLASPGARHITGQTLHVNGGAFTTR
ncbi:MAG TPA: SDR family oxidoreductase [Actinospica sp.]|nr:SDR family oxidoreductase [Actinospica sp.]